MGLHEGRTESLMCVHVGGRTVTCQGCKPPPTILWFTEKSDSPSQEELRLKDLYREEAVATGNIWMDEGAKENI